MNGARQMLEAARQAVRRGARLSQSLLAFARRQALRPEALDAAALLQEFTTLIRRALGETIALELVFEPRLPFCRADAAQLQTAVLNLVVNARDAMPEGGTLAIRAAQANLHLAELAGNNDAAPGNFVAVSVRDTGHGMTPEVLTHAFEPFFTTKEPGRGTGLGARPGLWLRPPARWPHYGGEPPRRGHDHDPLPAHGGRGRFRPRLAEGVAQAAITTVSSATVLIVEDEAAVREAAADMLREGGWRVIAAKDAHAALTVLETGETVDVLFSDVVMPGMNGVRLAQAAQRLRPGLPVLLTSGYAGEALVGEEPAYQVLSKPYERAELLARLGALAPKAPLTQCIKRTAWVWRHQFRVIGQCQACRQRQ